jgi:hypothetical protein
VLHILSVSVALVTQQEMRMRHIKFSSGACPGVPCFSTFPHERYDFRKSD